MWFQEQWPVCSEFKDWILEADFNFCKQNMDILVFLLSSIILLVAAIFLLSNSGKFRILKLMITKLPTDPIFNAIYDVLTSPRTDFANVLRKNVEKYGSLFFTWTGSSTLDVHLSTPEHLEVIMSSMKYIDKGATYSYLEPWLGTGLLTSTGQKWHQHRKMITPSFHFKILESFVEVFAENSAVLVEKLAKEVGNSGFDVYPYVTRCALDIICETAMGTSVDAQHGANKDYVTAVYDASELTFARRMRAWQMSDLLYPLSSSGRRYYSSLKKLHDFTKKVIRDRKIARSNSEVMKSTTSSDEDVFLGKRKRTAFLDMLLEASEQGAVLSDEEIREEVDTFMFEGHDTTSAGICWTIFLLGLHPDVQDKAYEELETIFHGSEASATMRDLQEMKYLERVIKEALRIYPSVPFIERMLTEDVTIDNQILPAGLNVLIHIYFVHRDKRYFPEPEKFDPDNFLPERIAKRHAYAYVPFSAGPRNCIGQKFALLEEKAVVSSVLRKYKIETLDTMENKKILTELILRPLDGIRIKITPRKSK